MTDPAKPRPDFLIDGWLGFIGRVIYGFWFVGLWATALVSMAMMFR